MRAHRISKWWSVLVAFVVAAIDGASKSAVIRRYGPESDRHGRALIGDWLSLSYARNTGVAFSMLRGHRDLAGLLGVVAVSALVVGYLRMRHQSPLLVVGAGLVGGGAVGNLVERLRAGHVTDFISVGRWPTFNLADSAITVGVIMLLWVFTSEDGAARAGTRLRLEDRR